MLLITSLMFLCAWIYKFFLAVLLSRLPFLCGAWRVPAELQVRKRRCGLLGRAAQQLECGWQSPPLPALQPYAVYTLEWQAFLSGESQCEDIFESTASGQTWTRGHGNSGGLIELVPFPGVCLAVTPREDCVSPPYVDLSFWEVCFCPGEFVVVRYIRQFNHGASWCLQTGKSRCSWWVIEGRETRSWQRQGKFTGESEYFIRVWM